MSQAFWTENRVAGAVLLASLLLLVLAAVIMVGSGAVEDFAPMVQGSLAQAAPYASTFQLLILLFVIGWIVQLLGLALLARLTARAGQEQLAVLAFTLVLVAVIIAVLQYTFRMSIDPRAAQDAARSVGVAAAVDWVRQWLADAFRIAYKAHFLAMIGFGLAILRSDIAASWVGPATVGWSTLLLIASALGFGIPALPFIMPAIIGFALLRG